MKILVTGGFGNIGIGVIKEATKRGHEVSVYEKFNKRNSKASKKHKDDYSKVIFGDIRNLVELAPAVREADAVINLASLIPPESEKDISVTHDVNVKGLENVINSIIISKKDIRLVHLSSVSVVGYTQDLKPPIAIDSPYSETNNYSVTKIACEKMLDVSKVNWCILRPANVINLCTRMSVEMIYSLFKIPLDYRMETVLDTDLVTAIINAAELMVQGKAISGKKLYIGGGEKRGHWHIYKEYLSDYLSLLKLKMPQERFFIQEKTYHDWYDSEEAEHYLKFQNSDFSKFKEALRNKHRGCSAVSKIMDYVFRLNLESNFMKNMEKMKGSEK